MYNIGSDFIDAMFKKIGKVVMCLTLAAIKPTRKPVNSLTR